MSDLIESELKNKKSSVDTVSLEKTIEHNTDEGAIKEKTIVTHKIDKGNTIDNVVQTVTESKSVQKAVGFLNKVARLGVSGVGGLFAAAGSYELLSKEIFSEEVTPSGTGGVPYIRTFVCSIPEPLCVIGSIVIGLIVATILFALYTKKFIK
ncbi:hypothetical protein [Sulfurovum sp.]|uniref:hypothetical protein n=1 Tax=Sulfurovum sp. TaxID=1969726 RepID=UPI002A364DB5|nr:hypothetical protein [Sulfurovum sp.]MDD2450318.1 hypothetical protein [Sulfurovum sp.]MDY0401883.1 hypothetical protein [Sulfurovum sp.]